MKAIIALTVAVLLSACATKSYHISAPLPEAKADQLSCRDLALELAEVDAVALQIQQEAKVDARSVGAFLMDFGIGNAMAKDKALEALATRRASITSAMAEKNCSSETGGVARSMETVEETASDYKPLPEGMTPPYEGTKLSSYSAADMRWFCNQSWEARVSPTSNRTEFNPCHRPERFSQ